MATVRRRLVVRGLPGYGWVQFCIAPTWRLGRWWSYKARVRTYAFGPFRVVTLRKLA